MRRDLPPTDGGVEPPSRGGPGLAWSRPARITGSVLPVVAVIAAWVAMVRAGVALHEEDLSRSWHLIDRHTLAHDPLGSVWYLHIQPPLHNLLVGSVLRWSPFPAMGTLMALYLLALVGTALLLTDLLARWRVHPVLAGGATALALVNPNLLSTVVVASYEIPVTLLLVGSLWWFQRQLQQPGAVPLIGLSVTLTALAMTRSLFHPALVVAVVVLAAVARRVPWRPVAVAVAIPLVVVGGWMVKNQVLFGTPTLSSWLGFNLQRGVVATMDRDEVEEAVEDGTVSDLALLYPWDSLPYYDDVRADCTPSHDHPAVTVAVRPGPPPRTPNFNNECYLPLYEQSQQDALALLERHPGRYLRTRVSVVSTSFSMSAVGVGRSGYAPPGRDPIDRTWMDDLGDALLVPLNYDVHTRDWNLPLFPGATHIPYRASLTLAALAVGVLARGLLAAARLTRSGWRERDQTWDADELLWVVVALTGVFVVLVGDLLEFGENGRFRSVLDPLLVALPLGALARIVGPLIGRRAGGDGAREPRTPAA